MGGMLERGLKADAMAGAVNQNDGDIGLLREGFRGPERLLAAVDGPRIAVLCIDGWDTHIDQGGTQGQHAGLLAELDTAIGDFRTCLGAHGRIPSWYARPNLAAPSDQRQQWHRSGVGTVTLLPAAR